MSPLLIQISKDFATIWTTTDPIGNVALFVGRLFARDDYFCVVAKPTKEFLAVLPAKSELGDVSETESANNISEEISLGFVEVGLHHGSFDQSTSSAWLSCHAGSRRSCQQLSGA